MPDWPLTAFTVGTIGIVCSLVGLRTYRQEPVGDRVFVGLCVVLAVVGATSLGWSLAKIAGMR